MPQRFTNPVIKYTTDTLKTLPGALLYFYENGTSTPKAVYQDVALTTPHTNPVVASSAGNFAPIFLAGTYRVELKNAAGVTQSGWPVDNVGGEETQGQFDDWSSITSYFEGDLVTGSNGLRYQATLLQPNLNRDPLTSPTYWTEVRFTSEYNPLSSYAVGDWVYYNNDWYKCKAVALGQTPSSSSAYWDAEKNLFQWNPTTTYADEALIYVGDDAYISQQNTNLNHNPVGDTSFTWWKPYEREVFEFNQQLYKVNLMSGGGTLRAEWCNMLTDGDAGYLLPLANTVPSGTLLVIAKSDIARTIYPIVTASGADDIAWLGGTDTSFQIDTQWADSMILYSNGTDQWSF